MTSLPQQSWPAQPLYEQHYCARGDMENRIKEQLMLFADRTSTAYLRSNQLRLYFSSVAYVLLQMLRRLGLQGNRVGPRPMRHDSAEAVKDRRSDPHHGTQGVGLPRGWLSLCRVVLADSCQAFCPAAAVLNQPASPKTPYALIPLARRVAVCAPTCPPAANQPSCTETRLDEPILLRNTHLQPSFADFYLTHKNW